MGAEHDGDGEGDDAGLEDEGEDHQRADVGLGPGLLVRKQDDSGTWREDLGLGLGLLGWGAQGRVGGFGARNYDLGGIGGGLVHSEDFSSFRAYVVDMNIFCFVQMPSSSAARCGWDCKGLTSRECVGFFDCVFGVEIVEDRGEMVIGTFDAVDGSSL